MELDIMLGKVQGIKEKREAKNPLDRRCDQLRVLKFLGETKETSP